MVPRRWIRCALLLSGEYSQYYFVTGPSTKPTFIFFYIQLLSSKMEQNGSVDEGILGFLPKDIQKCAEKCSRTRCCYCHEPSASIKCQRTKCRRNFHLICGHRKKCLFTFNKRFDSFCHAHHPIKDEIVNGHYNCMICWEALGDYSPTTSIPSCCDQGWFHARCLRKSTLTSGYLFKCPMCGNQTSEYLDLVRKSGVFVPEQDAAWELSQNAYTSLLFRYRSCDATICQCPNGRDLSVKQMRSEWFLLKCTHCDSKGIHYGCSESSITEYVCDNCTVIRSQQLISQEPQTMQPPPDKSNNAPKSPAAPICSIDTSSFRDASVQTESCEDALVSLPDLTDNHLKVRTLVFGRDLPPLDTPFVESQRQLRQERLNLLLFKLNWGHWFFFSISVSYWYSFIAARIPFQIL